MQLLNTFRKIPVLKWCVTLQSIFFVWRRWRKLKYRYLEKVIDFQQANWKYHTRTYLKEIWTRQWDALWYIRLVLHHLCKNFALNTDMDLEVLGLFFKFVNISKMIDKLNPHYKCQFISKCKTTCFCKNSNKISRCINL